MVIQYNYHATMPRLPRHSPRRVAAAKAASAEGSKASGQEAMEAAERQAAILVVAQADMPLPESLFYGLYFTKQIFDECYRDTGIRPTYIARTRYVRPSDLRKMIEHRAKHALSQPSVSNLPSPAPKP